MGGNVIFRINDMRDYHKKHFYDKGTRAIRAGDDPMEMFKQIADERTPTIVVGFTDGKKKAGHGLFNMANDKETAIVKPTVKSFWRRQGAVTHIYEEISKEKERNA